ncbi:hypothetical protein TVAG_416240 [Trichomonas vaginalis G3]|uniref:Uncharacterized protein n=1 Tax=Trichomonas vaginalis (strain ATCC PRA-98 / G3) TaxID=412133 RepID=A2FQ55_TRIV3|nr:intracellular sterol transport [Trichomonas vaginalis G3]EAX92962.1 hypothetical protein TVAG_416240 [Trichomonas vaginalis G3]KAI5512351.1 intracellular sterol transport [Trichomonas vaginalis G3]|eukprot:XP_001305892.1 hypothetical protein [Trichomonas vaginalis G3]
MPNENSYYRYDPLVHVSLSSSPMKELYGHHDFHFDLPNMDQSIIINFLNNNGNANCYPIGFLKLNTNSLRIGDVVDNWYPLTPANEQKYAGEVHLKLQVAPTGHPAFQPLNTREQPQNCGYYPQQQQVTLAQFTVESQNPKHSHIGEYLRSHPLTERMGRCAERRAERREMREEKKGMKLVEKGAKIMMKGVSRMAN